MKKLEWKLINDWCSSAGFARIWVADGYRVIVPDKGEEGVYYSGIDGFSRTAATIEEAKKICETHYQSKKNA